MATPVVALLVDGAYYDVAALQARWSIAPSVQSNDFHTRVIAARGVGLHELDARLRAGDRPAESRLSTADMLPLPPCDTERVSLFSLSETGRAMSEPRFARADARTLVGHGQPVPLATTVKPRVQVALGAVLGDELWRATAKEARRAIAGFTLAIAWTTSSDGGLFTLGPGLLVQRSWRDLSKLHLAVRCGDATHEASLDSRFHPAECFAFVSQRAPLRPGDVVVLEGALPDPLPIAVGTRVSATVAPLMRLGGWVTSAPEPVAWRF